MKILVLNGSPKGELSGTLRYAQFIARRFSEHELVTVNAAQRLVRLERDATSLAAIGEQVRDADAVLWAFPVYFFLVPSQYKRFIELLFERGVASAFAGKYAAALSTSVKVFDHNAHNYLRAVCEDLKMPFVGSYSAGMLDLVEPREQERLATFALDFFAAVAERRPTTRHYPPVVPPDFRYAAGAASRGRDGRGKRVLVVSDLREQGNLTAMIERFRGAFVQPPEHVSLSEIDIRGGCLGCLRCGHDNRCAWQGRDGFVDFYNQKVTQADVLVFGATVKDRHVSAKLRQFFDRSFFNGHVPTLDGKQVAFLIAGPVAELPDLRHTLEAWTEVQRANLVDIVADDVGDSSALDALIDALATRAVDFAERGYVKSSTFLGVGAHKILRDEVWGRLRFVFQADHHAYRRLGYYDFPQRDWRARAFVQFMMLATTLPAFRARLQRDMLRKMIEPIDLVLARLRVPAPAPLGRALSPRAHEES